MTFPFVRVVAALSSFTIFATACGSPGRERTEALGTASAPLKVEQWTSFPHLLGNVVSDNATRNPPAIAALDNNIILTHTGTDTNSLWWSKFDALPGVWNDNDKISDQLSKTGPRVAAFQDTLYMVHLGDETDRVWMSRFDKATNKWEKNFYTGLDSSASPAIVEVDKILYMIGVTPTTHQLWLSTMDANEIFTPPVPLPGMFTTPRVAPAVAVHNNRLFMSFVDFGSTLVLITSLDPERRGWAPPAPIWDGTDLQQQSGVQPTMASYDGNLHMVGTASVLDDQAMWTYSADGVTWSHPVPLLDHRMGDSGSLAALPDQLVFVHPCPKKCYEDGAFNRMLFYSLFR